ncbi:MAG: right-handed parallel beta-helix repeat-containing protein, partial [Elusimicrobiota bacterium]
FGGFASDYNDFFSSNSYSSAIWGNVSYPLLSGWRTASSNDLNSIRAHPRWADVSAGTEYFHPRSKAGRYNPLSGLMDLIDTVHSASIDRGAGFESFSQEPPPNGGRVNMGSYGNTAQASQGGLLCSTATNVRSGEWSDPETWDIGVEPGTCNKVDIATGTTVTVESFYATASTVNVYGTLSFSRVSNSSLTLVAGDLLINPGGHLDMGTESSPIPTGVNAQLILSSGTFAAQYGILVLNGGNFTVRGSTKTPASTAVSGDDLLTSENTLTLSESPAAAGWSVGDVITIGPTQGSGIASVEERRITGIAASVLTVDSNFSNVHYGTGTIRVGNLTRNALVRSSGTVVTASGGNSAYIRSLTQHATGFVLAHGEFAFLGGTNPGYGISVEGTSAKASISSCAVHDGNMGIHASSSRGNVYAYNLLYKHANYGLILENAPNNRAAFNHAYGNSGQGFDVYSANGNLLEGNLVYSNLSMGINLRPSQGSTLLGNEVFSNLFSGIAFFDARDDLFAGNLIHDNGSYGAYVWSNSHRNVWAGNRIYANQNSGFYLSGSSSNTFVDGAIGFDAAGAARPNKTAGVEFAGSGVESLVRQLELQAADG